MNELDQLRFEKKKLFSIVSHDLKSPLNRIFALCNLIEMEGDGLTGSQKDYIDKIQQVAIESRQLIKNLLDLRALEGGGIETHFDSFNISDLARLIFKNHSQRANAKEIKLISSIDKNLVGINDKIYLERIFDHLLSNAVKFSAKGASIEVLLSKKKDDFIFIVSDVGPGIKKKEVDKLFQKFEKLSSRPTGGEMGSGLGLFITSQLVHVLGGEINYKVNKSGGSTFSVRIPINQSSKK